MAGMYPSERTVEMHGKKVRWPGLDPGTGKFTNGNFNNPQSSPSFLPAETINLILDNMAGIIRSMGNEPDNYSVSQLADMFTPEIAGKKGIKRDERGRAKVAAPLEADDIARKAEVDTEASERVQADALKAPLASPALTGIPTAPTAAVGTNTSQIATTAFVRSTVLNSIFPVGFVYVQYPGCPDPWSIFAGLGFSQGMWTQLFNGEGITFRTEASGRALGFNGGIQEDAVQDFTGTLGIVSHGASKDRTGVFQQVSNPSGSAKNGSGSDFGAYVVSFGLSSFPGGRTAGETRMRNRTMRIWKRTA